MVAFLFRHTEYCLSSQKRSITWSTRPPAKHDGPNFVTSPRNFTSLPKNRWWSVHLCERPRFLPNFSSLLSRCQRCVSENGDICIVERLFSSSLVAIVSLSSPRKLKVCHFKKGTEICNYSYSNTILAVRLNRLVRNFFQKNSPALVVLLIRGNIQKCCSTWRDHGTIVTTHSH